MTPRTQAGRDLLAPYAGLSDEQVRAIEDEVLDRVRAAVEGLPEHGEWCGQGRGHWIGALTKSVVLDAIEQVRGG